MTVFAHSQTTNKLVNKAANDSARVSGQDGKKPPALGTNEIARLEGFRPFASSEKNTSKLARKKNTYKSTKCVPCNTRKCTLP